MPYHSPFLWYRFTGKFAAGPRNRPQLHPMSVEEQRIPLNSISEEAGDGRLDWSKSTQYYDSPSRLTSLQLTKLVNRWKLSWSGSSNFYHDMYMFSLASLYFNPVIRFCNQLEHSRASHIGHKMGHR